MTPQLPEGLAAAALSPGAMMLRDGQRRRWVRYAAAMLLAIALARMAMVLLAIAALLWLWAEA